jgi:hypothetical protein
MIVMIDGLQTPSVDTLVLHDAMPMWLLGALVHSKAAKDSTAQLAIVYHEQME